MPPDSTTSVLDGIRALATEQNWAPVSAFLQALAPSGDRAILIAAAPGVDPAPPAAWLAAADQRARCHLASLTQLAEDPGLGLVSNRVVVALQCGDRLMPSSVAGARAAHALDLARGLSRPAQLARLAELDRQLRAEPSPGLASRP